MRSRIYSARLRLVFAALLFASLFASVSVFSAPEAKAYQGDGQPYGFWGDNSGLCWNVWGNPYYDGASLIQDHCNADHYQFQSWSIRTVGWNGSDRIVEIRSLPDGNCLDLDHSYQVKGNRIQIWHCNGTDAQHWVMKIHKSYGIGDQVELVSRGSVNSWSPKCIDVPYSSTIAGTSLWLWDCNGTNAQRFWLTKY